MKFKPGGLQGERWMNDLKVVVRGVEDTFLITGIVLKERECLRGF